MEPSMSRTTALTLLVAASFFSTFAHAAAPMRAGLWEITARMQGEGMPSAPPQTVSTCISQKDIDSSKGGAPGSQRGMEDCAVSDYRQDGDKASWTFSCKGRGAMAGAGSIQFGTDSFTQTTTMKTGGSNKVAISVNTTGKRVGDCPK
jgi:hypothetical protein